jgi:predicted type IV restriction endonuclease
MKINKLSISEGDFTIPIAFKTMNKIMNAIPPQITILDNKSTYLFIETHLSSLYVSNPTNALTIAEIANKGYHSSLAKKYRINPTKTKEAIPTIVALSSFDNINRVLKLSL